MAVAKPYYTSVTLACGLLLIGLLAPCLTVLRHTVRIVEAGGSQNDHGIVGRCIAPGGA